MCFHDFIVFVQYKQIQDRKSTRLNSSHVRISYAVFCLKKKNRCCSIVPPSSCSALTPWPRSACCLSHCHVDVINNTSSAVCLHWPCALSERSMSSLCTG